MIGNGWIDTIDTVTIQSVLFETRVGKAWRLQALAALLLLLTAARA
jgi:putative copper export protein